MSTSCPPDIIHMISVLRLYSSEVRFKGLIRSVGLGLSLSVVSGMAHINVYTILTNGTL